MGISKVPHGGIYGIYTPDSATYSAVATTRSTLHESGVFVSRLSVMFYACVQSGFMFPTSQFKFINSVLVTILCGTSNCMLCVFCTYRNYSNSTYDPI